MALVPAEEVARIEREVSVERLAEARGVKFTRHGADLLGLCPFHDDKEPSLVITPKRNPWRSSRRRGTRGTALVRARRTGR
ncbi:MAG: hypothetical protein D6773_11545 [Alphaproteobacteria bacterium]|nr:MAG: hypothetical protein D6773_11545 [Alphaproteobacteria bacterium]